MTYLWQSHLGDGAAFDAAYHTKPRTEILSFVSEFPGTVLDVGCGGGATGRLLKEKFPQTRVVGVEANREAAEHARRSLDHVVCKRIEDVTPASDFPGERFATVLLLDVLEHLYDPWHALLRVRDWLSPDARVIASVPNVRNLVTLSDIAAGRFEYDANGVLDITHLRFFTRSTLLELFTQTGYDVRRIDPLTQPEIVDQVIVDRRPGRLDTRSVSIRYRSFEDLEDLYALQYVVDARAAAGIAPAG